MRGIFARWTGSPDNSNALRTSAVGTFTHAPFSIEVSNEALAVEPVLYAIGDVHGMDDLLAALLEAIHTDAEKRGRPAKIIFLGDLVNRGPHTRRVLDRILAGPERPQDIWVALAGNHEQLMVEALASDHPADFRLWLKRGGLEALSSYGPVSGTLSKAKALEMVDPAHIALLKTLPLFHQHHNHVFVHAGVQPGVPLLHQSPQHLQNIRGPFLKRPHGLPFQVVHGHTPTDGLPLLGPARVGVDTGAVLTGVLTAFVIDNLAQHQSFLQVKAGKGGALSRRHLKMPDSHNAMSLPATTGRTK